MSRFEETGSTPSLTPPPKPPLKWAGGKRWQLRFLTPLWAPHAERRLVEPFCGGMAVALGALKRAARTRPRALA
jgi:hypothetical protein